MRTASLLAVIATPLCLTAQESNNVAAAAATITADDIIAKVGVLAHDSMQGRLTPSPELEQTARWVGAQFQALGLRPGGEDGSFIQRYELHRVQLDTDASGVSTNGGIDWRFGEHLGPLLGSTDRDGVSGPVTFLAGGVSGSSALESLDLAGRVVLWQAPTAAGGGPDFTAVNQALPALMAQQPAAVVLMLDRPRSAWTLIRRRLERASVVKSWEASSSVPVLEVQRAAAVPLLNRHGLDPVELSTRRLAGYEVEGLTLRVIVTNRILDTISAPNTVGILEGSDPVLRDEYVVYSAHMDHVGTSENGGQCRRRLLDKICNGADDDASGTSAMIEVAEAFASLEVGPRRSIVFLAVSGEEQGLWGSDYFAANPGMPIDQIVANLNADMVGRNSPDSIVVIGKEHSDLGATLNAVARAHPELRLVPSDDIWPQENFYQRSDHFNFARRGVPVLFFFNGTHPQYHQPTDEVDLIDGDKAARIGRLMFYLGLEIANREARPAWNPESYRSIVGR